MFCALVSGIPAPRCPQWMPAQAIAVVTAGCAASDTNPNQGKRHWQFHTGHGTTPLTCFYGQGTQTLNCQVPLRMQNATLKKSQGKAIQREEKDGNIYHSTTLTKNKPWQQAPMHCLVYANAGCSSCWDQKHNKLSVSLNAEGCDSHCPCWQSPLPAFEWEGWIGDTATLEHIQDCFDKSKTVFTSSSF